MSDPRSGKLGTLNEEDDDDDPDVWSVCPTESILNTSIY